MSREVSSWFGTQHLPADYVQVLYSFLQIGHSEVQSSDEYLRVVRRQTGTVR